MKYGSVCSGVEAATVAWHPLGWEPQWFSEIEPFPSEVLAQHYPDTPNFGDMTKFKEWPNDRPVDLLVGGTPCQSFSVAGLRKGLDDPRGNLMLTYLAIAERYSPRWLVWENVPGVLSSNRGRDFGTFLGALGQLGYGFAYRVLDAQYFGVAQRRRRVFVVAGSRSGCAEEVLALTESCGGNPPTRGEAREAVAANAARCFAGSREASVAAALETTCHDYSRADGFNMVAQPFSPHGHYRYEASDQSATLQGRENRQAGSTHLVAQAFRKSKRAQTANDDETWVDDGLANTLNGFDTGDARTTHAVATPMVVRRLTPVECERLQGFPDGWTDIGTDKPTADSHRYKQLGNAVTVNVAEWIARNAWKVLSEGTNKKMED